MKNTMKKVLAFTTAASMAFAATGLAAEAADISWPEETITLEVPAAAGGGTDLAARVWAQYASEKLGVSVIVNNVTGGGGTTATRNVLDAKPDGYDILFWHNGVLLNSITGLADYDHTAFAMGPQFVYDQPCCVFVQADNAYGWETFDDVVATAKENPGTITVATEIGSYTYFELLAIQQATGAEFAITDGGSNSEKVTGLLGGAFDVMLNAYSTAGSYVESGDFLCLAVPTEERCENFPDVPTIKELGYDVVYDGYYFTMLLPKDTPQEIIDALDEVTKEITEDEAAQEDVANIQLEMQYRSSADAKTTWDDLLATYQELNASLSE